MLDRQGVHLTLVSIYIVLDLAIKLIWCTSMQGIYTQDDKTHKYIHKLLSLAYLPPEHIGPIFEKLQQKAATQPPLDLTNYIATT